MRRIRLAFALLSLAGCGGNEQPPLSRPRAVVPDAASAVDLQGVSGVVEAPDGHPAAGAIVALNGVKNERLALVRTDAAGHFHTARPMGPFAITATSERGTAAFVAPREAATGTALRLRLQEEASGVVITGSLSSRSKLPADTFVGAARHSADEGDVFFAEVSDSGAFTLRLPPGRYTVQPRTSDVIARSMETGGTAGEHAAVDIEASARALAPEEVVRWLAGRALPIATEEPQSKDDDLSAVGTLLAKARVIGVGEATHGTREYFRIKHRLLERLVARHGVTMLAMEANFSDAERVDAWLQSGRGTVEEAMRGLFVVWRTEEIRDLLVWMRQWNADPRHRRKLRFAGYDVQGTRAVMMALRAYLHQVDPAAEAALLEPLAPLDADADARGGIALGATESIAVREAVSTLLDRLDHSRGVYVARSSVAAHALAMQQARVLEQARVRFTATDPRAQFAARDRAMADNVAWLVDQVAKDERVMVWAHNGHVQLDSSSLLGPNMGSRLRERLGADYVSVGFVLDEGTYRAWEKPDGPALADVSIGPREPGWAAEAFARVGVPMFAADLREPPAGSVRDWLFAPHVVHSCGWVVSEPERRGAIETLGRLFDVAIYVDHTTSARQLVRRR